MRIIITGANGFIGFKLVNYYALNGHVVYALCQINTNMSIFEGNDNIHTIPFYLDDLTNVFKEIPYDCDILYHMAWVGVGSNYKNNPEMQLKNIEYGVSILKMAQMMKVKKIIFPGSVSEYAFNSASVNGEGTPCPVDLYSATKVALRYICEVYAKQNSLNFIWVLLSSVYGPGRDDNNIISYSIKELLAGRSPSYTKLEQLWDYIYIDDLINALYNIGLYGSRNVYAVGSGKPVPLKDVVKLIHSLTNPTINLNIGALEYKGNRIDNSIVDVSNLIKDTGFKPEYDLEKGIKKTISYFIKVMNK